MAKKGAIKRKLLDGTVVPEAAEPVKMDIVSKCPAKWLYVDREDGNVWARNPDPTFPFAFKLFGTARYDKRLKAYVIKHEP